MKKAAEDSDASTGRATRASVRWWGKLTVQSGCAIALVFGGGTSRIQANPPPPSNRTLNLNYVYAADLGFGGYSIGGLTTSVYELPLEHTVQDFPNDALTLRIMAPIQVGFYSVNVTDTDGQRFSEDLQSLAFVPGVELQIPLGSRTVLKPFGQFGAGHLFGGDGGSSRNAYIYLGGARATSQWSVGSSVISLGEAVIYAGDSPIGSGFSEHYVSLQIGTEVRHNLGVTIRDITPDLGLYAIYHHYPSPLVFNRFLASDLEIRNQGEIGVSIGSASAFRLLGLSNPRIGVGFIYGGGLNVWRISFGFPF
jgi:hypothetical protein